MPVTREKTRKKAPTKAAAPPARSHLSQSTTRYEMFANSLVADIESGRYPVGALLPPEPELCAHYGLSRHTVREGVRKLVDMGQVPLGYGPAETAAFMRAESTKYKTLIERSGIRLDPQ